MQPSGRAFETPALSAVQTDWCLLAKRKWRAVHAASGRSVSGLLLHVVLSTH